jgi:hypothetical protein
MSDAPKRPAPLRARVGLALFGVALALVVGEVAARATRGGYDARVRAIGEAIVERGASGAHRLRPGASADVGGVAYRVSSIGTRGPEPSREKPAVRILALGDSVTMGLGVAERDAWPARVEAELSEGREGVEVVNAAVLGWGIEQYVARLDELAPRLRPDVVLVGYFPNDPGGTESVVERPRLRSELLALVAERLRGASGGASATATYRALHAEGSPGWARTVRSSAALGARCRALDARCAVVLLPALDEAPYPLAAEHARVAALAEEHGLSVLDLAPAIEGGDPRARWVAPDDAHPDRETHALYGTLVARWLVSERLVP